MQSHAEHNDVWRLREIFSCGDLHVMAGAVLHSSLQNQSFFSHASRTAAKSLPRLVCGAVREVSGSPPVSKSFSDRETWGFLTKS